MLERGDHVLAAVSGGADSTALLLCLHDLAPGLNLRLTVAHFNHRLRGAESDADEEFVRMLSGELGLPLVCEAADLNAGAAAGRPNLEEAAREARYDFLRRAAAHAGAAKIATGHNLNDQAETVLYRLLRGCGPGGLEGIHAVLEGRIIRPLLECSRHQILEFLAGRNARFREDSTNRELAFRRNRIRHELIPYLKEHFNPRLVAALTREARLMASTHDFLATCAASELADLRVPLAGGIALPAARLMQMHPALRHEVVRQALRDLRGSLRGIATVHIEDILHLCAPGQSGRSVELPGELRAQRNLELLEMLRDHPRPGEVFRYELPWPGACLVREVGMQFSARIEGEPGDLRGCATGRACLDPDAIPSTLVIRSRLPGDRYGGPSHRKVKKMLLAARVPLPSRDGLPMIAAGETIIWIPGFKPAKNFRAKPGSGRCVIVEAGRIEGTADD